MWIEWYEWMVRGGAATATLSIIWRDILQMMKSIKLFHHHPNIPLKMMIVKLVKKVLLDHIVSNGVS